MEESTRTKESFLPMKLVSGVTGAGMPYLKLAGDQALLSNSATPNFGRLFILTSRLPQFGEY